MTFLHLLAAILALYLCVGLVLACIRATGPDIPWQLFLFIVVLWPFWIGE